jgi:transcriptional regulator with XRE-family HTH domain
VDNWTIVRNLIAQKRLRKSHFAKKMDISRNTLDSWLKDTTSPDQTDVKKMSEILSEMPDDVKHTDGKVVSLNKDLIPFYDAAAVGGQALLADQTPVSAPVEYINPGSWLRSATGSLRVYGNSMFPKYPAGCIIAFKDNKSGVIIWGEDYVIELEDRRIVKRLERSDIKDHVKAVIYR